MDAVQTEADRLLIKYLEMKREIHFGRKSIADMDDEHMAGSLIRLFGSDALIVFGMFPKLMKKAYRRKWPRVEEILEKALVKRKKVDGDDTGLFRSKPVRRK